MDNPYCNIPITEMFFSESPVVLIGVNKITKKTIIEVIKHTVSNNRAGPKTYLIKDEKS